MRAALIVGVDYYKYVDKLYGCVNDAHSVNSILQRHDGGTLNFDCNLLTGTSQNDAISKNDLKDNIEDLFAKDMEVALFYFAGHGYIEPSGGYIIASDTERGDNGISLSEILNYANKSPAENKIIILDSCHAGKMGDASGTETANLAEGVTVLTDRKSVV